MKKSENEKTIDSSIYNEKSLYLLNIRELRDLGRKFGVPSPTTMKKSELVSYILKVVYGEVSVPVHSSFGRPNVREFNFEKCLEKIKKNADISEELKMASLEDVGMGKVASFAVPSECGEIETRVFVSENGKNTLRVRQFVESKGDIEISKEIVEKFGLQNFDVVEIIVGDGNIKIVSVNAKKVQSGLENIRVGKRKLSIGTNQDFYLSTKEKIREEIENLSKSCEEIGARLIVIGRNEYKGKNTECLRYGAAEESASLYKKLVYLIGLCEKAMYDGVDFILAIEDAEEFEKIANSFEEDISERIKKYIRAAFPKFTWLGNVILPFRIEKELNY